MIIRKSNNSDNVKIKDIHLKAFGESEGEEIAEIGEPLNQIVTRSFVNKNDADTEHQISSTGPMIVNICGSMDSPDGSSATFSVTKDGATVTKKIPVGVEGTDAECLTIGADSGEILNMYLGVGFSSTLNTIITIQTIPAAEVFIIDL